MRYRDAAILGLLALAACALSPPALLGQAVEGRVVDVRSGAPLEGAHVRLLGDDGPVAAAFSNGEGYFHLDAPGGGEWRITAELLGYGSLSPAPIAVPEDEPLMVELRLSVEPVQIEEPVRVIGRRSHVNLAIERFRRRSEQGERTGMGHFLSSEELERRGSARLSDVLRTVPGVYADRTGVASGQILRMRGGCLPAVYLDGMHLNRVDWKESLDHYVSTSEVEGVEVYRGSEYPDGFDDPSGCGVILVWTRNRASEPGASFSWSRFAVGIALIVGLLMLH